MPERPVPAAHLTDDDLAIMTSGRPYLGGWGTGAPSILTHEAMTEFRGRMLAMATHEHAHCFDAEPNALGYVDTVPPLVKLTGFLFEALHGHCVIVESTAFSDLFADFKVTGSAGHRRLSFLTWTPTFNGMKDVWQLLRSGNSVAVTAQIIIDVLEVLTEAPSVADAAEAGIRLVSGVVEHVPEARLAEADDNLLAKFFADALDERGAEALPWLRGADYYFERLARQMEASARALREFGIVLPTLEDLLVHDLVNEGGILLPEIRTALGHVSFIGVAMSRSR